MGQKTSGTDRRGAALLLSITMLALMGALGTFYLRHMYTNLEEANYDVRRTRARALAGAGVYAAIGELEFARRLDRTGERLGKINYPFTTFKAERVDGGLSLEEETRSRASVSVTVSDESGKVNLNHAPVSVLQRVLGVDGDTARRIVGSLPRERGESAPEAQWLLRPHDLLTRGLLTSEQFSRVNLDLITTYTVVDHKRPLGFININAAPPPVVGALLDVPDAVAERVSAHGNITSLVELAEAAEKDPSTFNMRPDPLQPGTFPPAFSTKSRCFRVKCVAEYAGILGLPGSARIVETSPVTATVEAVILFDEQGSGYRILHWSGQRNEET